MTAILLTGYALAVAILSLVHDPRVLAVVLLLTLGVAGREAPGVARRALLAVVLFSGVVSVAYAASQFWRGDSPWAWLLRTNLRVLALTTLTLTVAGRVDLVGATARLPALQFVVILTLAQIRTLRRLWTDFRSALKSRALRRPGPGDALRHGGAAGGALLRRAEHDLEARLRTMEARGFFVDADRG
jgi:cobalt/nickel transport system permease protein